MTKNQFIEKIVADTGLTKEDVSKVLQSQADAISMTLAEGTDPQVIVPDLCTVTRVVRSARTYKIPGTEKEVEVPARFGLKFKPAKRLRESIETEVTESA